MTNDRLLGIYLNDHLAGAVAGTELAQRIARDLPVLDQLAAEIAEDRKALLDIMAALGIQVQTYKTWAAWAAEKVARLKFNGYLVTRSPLSRVVELEAMMLGVNGKAAGWRTLRALAKQDQRLDAARLDELIQRAEGQIDTLEQLRVQPAAEAFGGGPD
jgi:hypothetical protein